MAPVLCRGQSVTRACAQLCPTVCDSRDCGRPGSSDHGIFQARMLEWAARFLLQRIFPTQGSNPCLLHWQVDSLPLSHCMSSFTKQNTVQESSFIIVFFLRDPLLLLYFFLSGILYYYYYFFPSGSSLRRYGTTVSFLFFFFDVDHFFKKYIECVTILLLLFMLWFFGLEACGVLASPPGMEPSPPCTERWSLNHWTTEEVPRVIFKGFPSNIEFKMKVLYLNVTYLKSPLTWLP